VADNVHHILVSSPWLFASLRKNVTGDRFDERIANHSMLCGNQTPNIRFLLTVIL